MPALIRNLTPDGLQPAAYNAESLADASRHEPGKGVYTITNTFERFGVLKWTAHLDRLEDSAQRAGVLLSVDRPRLGAALRAMIEEADWGDVRFRITAPADHPDTFILSIEPFKPLAPEIYARGVKCITLPGSARHNPAAKTTDWVEQRKPIEAALPDSIFTGLLLDEAGNILEGLSSNFYGIINGELRTAGDGVLPGIAQQIVFEIAPDILPVRREAINRDQLATLNEAFITSSSRGIVPVIEIDGIIIGDGTPGAVTRHLRARYAEWMQTHLEIL